MESRLHAGGAFAGSNSFHILKLPVLNCGLPSDGGTPYEDSIFFRKIGTPSVATGGPHEMVEVAAAYLASYDDDDAGKTAHW